jgi:hypothetical protein
MTCESDSIVSGRRDPRIELVDVFNCIRVFPADLTGIIGGTIVHHDDLTRSDYLPKHALNRPLQQTTAIKRRDDHRKLDGAVLIGIADYNFLISHMIHG